MDKLSFHSLNADTLLIQWNSSVDQNLLYEIVHTENAIHENLSDVVLETYPAYTSIAVHYNPQRIAANALAKAITSCLAAPKRPMTFSEWQLPVCYDSTFASDLEPLAKAKNLTPETLIQKHSEPTYLVHFIGFLPGFLYLGGLPDTLHHPRKATPDRAIASGAVAIGGSQTGIYPMESPGGWHVIGNCPISFFNPQGKPPCRIRPGDRVRFQAISVETHRKLAREKNDVLNPIDTFQWDS
ncbi:5-oxoprolinase subunit PxpB [Marinoscillum furvescens]|nr:5-oxoprolinase subunit PxpB [Marinoscillum furvescens]